jgi:hypothetical protein
MPEKEAKARKKQIRRPFFLSFLCIVGFTYTLLFAVLFIFGMLYSTGISGILDNYLRLYDLTRMNFFLFSLGGFLVFFTSFLGVLLMWKLQKLGFYVYTLSVVVFLIAEIILAGLFWPDVIIHGVLISLFLVAFPFSRRRREKLISQA